MNFFNINPNALPADAQYYFNIAVMLIYVPNSEAMEELCGVDLETYWDISALTEPRPSLMGIIKVDEEAYQELFADETEYYIEVHPHCVVEVSPTLGIGWYEMFGEDETTYDPWRLD